LTDPFAVHRLHGKVVVVTGSTQGQTGTGAPDDWRAAADASRPFGRLLGPDDIAPMVTYLLSNAAQMVTGSVIDFDQTVHGPYGEHVAPRDAGVAA
jgi:enoyl-[acyl-carrier-protein] reductase (NADH)